MADDVGCVECHDSMSRDITSKKHSLILDRLNDVRRYNNLFVFF